MDSEQLLCQCWDMEAFEFFDRRDIIFKTIRYQPYSLETIFESVEFP